VEFLGDPKLSKYENVANRINYSEFFNKGTAQSVIGKYKNEFLKEIKSMVCTLENIQQQRKSTLKTVSSMPLSKQDDFVGICKTIKERLSNPLQLELLSEAEFQARRR
jgi:hypothetical protein